MDTKSKTTFIEFTKRSKKYSKTEIIEKLKTEEQKKKDKRSYFYSDGTVIHELKDELYTKIVHKTGLEEDEILDFYEKFHREYPEGKITLEEYKNQSNVNITFSKSLMTNRQTYRPTVQQPVF